MTLTIIDTFGFLFRNYYALPPLKSKKGFPTGMITGFMNYIYNLSQEENEYVIFSVDSKGKTIRHDIYPDYKANRPEAPEDLKIQLPVAISLIEKMGFHNISKQGYESDDIIASLASLASKKGIKVDVVSHDKDMYQLIDEHIKIFDPIKKKRIDREGCFEKFGVYPEDFVNFQALLGDSADNIPGVKGVGVKTASKLINQYKTLENLYNHIDELKGAVKKRLIENRENAFLSRELVTLHKDLFTELNLEEYKVPKNPISKIEKELIDLGLNSIVQKVTHKKATISQKIEFEAVTLSDKNELNRVIDSIKDEIVAFDTETTSVGRDKEIVGFSFAFEEKKAYYVPINHFYLGVQEQISQSDALKALKKLTKKNIIGHNLKFDLSLLRKYEIDEVKPQMDTMILAWILSPDEKVGLDFLAKKYLSYEMIAFKDTVKKGENFSSVNIEEATKYASEDAFITLKLYHILKEKLNWDILDEIENVEIPFIDVLMDMEEEGIKIDTDYFQKLQQKLKNELEILKNSIFKEADEEFNLNSPKQLGVILFEKLQLPAKKKTKTGYSTNEQVLEGLKENHPIISMILKYRELFKLQSTYIEPLLKYAKENEENRIYTNFLQTGTATGRLSSKDPNLQNIPVNRDINIRNGFVTDKLFVSLDYSQIELRLLAHFSEDEVLVEAFRNDKDIHLETAQKIFADKAKEMRSVAKSINFGLIYGMGSRKLSQTINVSTKEAKEFIDKYFESFPSVREFLNSQKELVKKRGYVETLLKRRRFFDFNSVNSFMASNFEREGVNTIFQGSAADLIKLSMIEIHKLTPKPKMILQIHDELIFEVENEKEAEKYKEIMENIYPLKVPLKVGMSFAKRWGELK